MRCVRFAMERYLLNITWLAIFVVPLVVFISGKNLGQNDKTFYRALIAISCGWLTTVLYAYAVPYLTNQFPHGPANATAAMFGWVLPAVVVILTWTVYWFVKLRGKNEEI